MNQRDLKKAKEIKKQEKIRRCGEYLELLSSKKISLDQYHKETANVWKEKMPNLSLKVLMRPQDVGYSANIEGNIYKFQEGVVFWKKHEVGYYSKSRCSGRLSGKSFLISHQQKEQKFYLLIEANVVNSKAAAA